MPLGDTIYLGDLIGEGGNQTAAIIFLVQLLTTEPQIVAQDGILTINGHTLPEILGYFGIDPSNVGNLVDLGDLTPLLNLNNVNVTIPPGWVIESKAMNEYSTEDDEPYGLFRVSVSKRWFKDKKKKERNIDGGTRGVSKFQFTIHNLDCPINVQFTIHNLCRSIKTFKSQKKRKRKN